MFRRPPEKKFDITPSPRVDEQTWRLLEKLCPSKRVLLQYSTGKDSIACWIELKERGYTVIPVFKEIFQNISFFDKPIAAHEEYFGQEVHIVPNRHTFLSRVELFNSEDDLSKLGLDGKMAIEQRSFSKSWLKRYRRNMVDMLMKEHNCEICVVGTKASDSIHRRTHFTVDGPYLPSERLLSLVWRMTKGGPIELAIDKKCPLPEYYLWLGRSPEFILEQEFYFIKRYYPEDWDKLTRILANVDVYVKKYEHNLSPKHIIKTPKVIKQAKEDGHPFV